MITKIHSEELDFLEKGRFYNQYETSAHWLKSDYEDNKWNIGSNTINWSRTLPDETHLNESCNQSLLAKTKRVIFEIRNSTASRLMNDCTHYRHSCFAICLLDFVVMNKEIYRPHNYYFSALDTTGLKEFLNLYSKYGTDGVSNVQSRLENVFKRILNEFRFCNIDKKAATPQYIYNENTKNKIIKTYSDEDIYIIKTWLFHNNFYKFQLSTSNYLQKGMINRARISQLLGKDKYNYSPKIDMFLRQFEYVDDYTEIEFNTKFKNNEYIPSNALLTEEAADQPFSESIINNAERSIATLRRLSGLVDGLPTRSVFNGIKTEISCIRNSLKEIQHYRTTPVPIALKVMNEVIRYILLYGQPLVDFALNFARECRAVRNYNTLVNIRDDIFSKMPMPIELIPLNITTAKSFYDMQENKIEALGRYAAPRIRKTMSLEDAIGLLISSVYIITASLTAQRKEALCELRLDCITGTVGCYEINLILPKANFNENRAVIPRPVPDFVANSLSLITKFTQEWSRLFQVNYEKYLFWIPSQLMCGNRLTVNTVDIFLDRFSDYIELPLNKAFRRWYIRTHECRRFFAIVFFWQFKFANISALQWMLGHVNPEHTYAYIKEMIGGSELTAEEARFTCDAIRCGVSNSGLTELRRLVQLHFHTSDVQLIEEDDLEFYLKNLLDKGIYKVIPHTIETSKGVKYEILFEVSENAFLVGACND